MTGSRPVAPDLWAGQVLHAACLLPLLALAWLAWRFLDEPYPVAFWTAIAIPVMHQLFVWLTWRLELQSGTISRTIGFSGYLIVFFFFLLGRPVAVCALAWMDRGSLGVPPTPRIVAAVLLGLLSIYALYSVKRYFGFRRAAGADHFEPRYRSMPPVKQGIFRFTDNGMYLYGFLLFWAVAIGFDSAAGIVAAAFGHAYIWVHFYATEKPDMDYLYAPAKKRM